MPEGMAGDPFGDTRGARGLTDGFLESALVYVMAARNSVLTPNGSGNRIFTTGGSEYGNLIPGPSPFGSGEKRR
jgi:hypothetical protein